VRFIILASFWLAIAALSYRRVKLTLEHGLGCVISIIALEILWPVVHVTEHRWRNLGYVVVVVRDAIVLVVRERGARVFGPGSVTIARPTTVNPHFWHTTKRYLFRRINSSIEFIRRAMRPLHIAVLQKAIQHEFRHKLPLIPTLNAPGTRSR
jgi:hypothetical protein